MAGSMRTFVTDGRTDWRTDWRGWINKDSASPKNWSWSAWKQSCFHGAKFILMCTGLTGAVHRKVLSLQENHCARYKPKRFCFPTLERISCKTDGLKKDLESHLPRFLTQTTPPQLQTITLYISKMNSNSNDPQSASDTQSTNTPI